MANYKGTEKEQGLFLTVNLMEQILSGRPHRSRGMPTDNNDIICYLKAEEVDAIRDWT
jgi:hypothetical protein